MHSVKRHLSNSPSGTGIKITPTDSANVGQRIHTHGVSYEDSIFDEVYLYAYNSHSSSVTVTLQWGGVVGPDNLISLPLASNSFLNIVCGLPISGKKLISATASVADKIVIYGHVACHLHHEKTPAGADSDRGQTGNNY